MPDIKDSVGETGRNQVHDVALVQVMLRIVTNAQGLPYLPSAYDGIYGTHTKNAIMAFQKDQKIIGALPAKALAPPLPGPAGVATLVTAGALQAVNAGLAAAPDKLGFIDKNGPTFKKLSAMLPADRAALRVIEGLKTVYLEDSAVNAATSKFAILADKEMDPSFQTKVGQLVDKMFQQHKIVLWLTPTGRRRNFAQQMAETATNAGPGESNHNFGRAVDIGFKDFRWIKGDGQPKTDADWLNALEVLNKPKADAFWDKRDAIAFALGLHRLQMERVHLQSFDQNTVNNPRSLVKLLNTVGAMSWDLHYKSDLGYGGALFPVGTARQIWSNNAMVTKTMIAQAKSAKLGKIVKEDDIKAQDVLDAKQALKHEFELADQNWIKWVGVP
jgi:hypothetical protein